MKENQIILKWQKVDDKKYQINLPANLPKELSIYRFIADKEWQLPIIPVWGHNVITLDEGHDFRIHNNKLLTTNLDIVHLAVLIEWGDDTIIKCINNHSNKMNINMRFCPECGVKLISE